MKQKFPLAGVVGWPVKHSLSPRLHKYWLKKYNLAGEYQTFEVRPEDLPDFMSHMGDQNITGLNFTVPHKELILPFLDDIDPLAQKIGAVNMVTMRNKKRWGQNSDAYGFITNLKEQAPNWRAEQGSAAIIGAGGAARAVVVSLLSAGVPEIRLINRTRARAENLCQVFRDKRLKIGDWSRRADELQEVSLLVNVTSLGMTGQPPLDLDLSSLSAGAVVYDIVYNPLETDLLKAARAQGCHAVDGLGMLLHQAVPAFQAWFGIRPEVDDELRQYILAGLSL